MQYPKIEDRLPPDDWSFPPYHSGRRTIVIDADSLNVMLGRLYAVFGSGAGAIIDQMGEAMGRQFASELTEDFDDKVRSPSKEDLLDSYSALGFASIEIESDRAAESPSAIHARQNFECEGNAKQRIYRKSVFFRAHLRGFISVVYGSEFEVTEVRCIAEGDEVCSFAVVPRESLAFEIPVRE